MSDKEYLSPGVLTEFVNFSRKDSTWQYGHDDKSMESKQAEGAATLWNLMQDGRVAILADEVGMGKTIQALSICAALWRKNPSARILVLAPREAVARNWANEYHAFITTHYREFDDRVKTSVEGRPVHEPIVCSDIYDLCARAMEGWGRLFIAKTTSFSYLLSGMSGKGKYEVLKRKFELLGERINKTEGLHKLEKREQTGRIAERLRGILLEKELRFDLLILDEAHYYRNINHETLEADSLRVISAKHFFGAGRESLASKVLLLTATPNHSSPDNVKSIVSYFDKELAGKTPVEILKQVAVRRYRTLGREGKIKFNYRNETAVPAHFSDDVRSELFYALYQKKLVEYGADENTRQRRLFYGYMEGFEFIPLKNNQKDEAVEPGEVEEDWDRQVDFTDTDDTVILRKLVNAYSGIFGQESHPSHPKYDKTVEDVSPDDAYWQIADFRRKKSLIFVRRIPSINEISRRVMQRYDLQLWGKIAQALGVSGDTIPGREQFFKFFENDQNSEEETEDRADDDGSTAEQDEDKGIPTSRVFDLFSMQRKDSDAKIKNTHAALFRRRFAVWENMFYLFFQHGPAPGNAIEELIKPYTFMKIYRKSGKADYYLTSGVTRVDFYGKTDPSSAQIMRNINYSEAMADQSEDLRGGAGGIDTLWTLFWNLKNQENECQQLLEKWKAFSVFERESLSQFVLKGILFASPALVELYAWFIETERESKETGKDLYVAFIEKVRARLKGSRLYSLIAEAITHFKVFHEKIVCVSDHDLRDEQWRFFEQAMPVYPYSGGTKNRSILNAFNTPFYPDVLVATSVLQEGVNLQYFCKRVIHYGIAWTAGDNEQRVGRVDRMFGLVERELDEKIESSLEIRYPYIVGTLDEDQLTLFLQKKYEAESLMDKCMQDRFSTDYAVGDISAESMHAYLRKPLETVTINDPYPADKAHYHEAVSIKYPYKPIDDSVRKIQGIFHSLGISGYAIWDEKHRSRLICILDAKTSNGRKQPVLVELHFVPQFSVYNNQIVYVLSMKTPLCPADEGNIEIIENEYGIIRKQLGLYPGVQLAMDDTSCNASRYKIYTRVSLPLFRDLERNQFLHSEEIRQSVSSLIECTDAIENALFPNQDISLDDLKKDSQEHIPSKLKNITHVSNEERKSFSDVESDGSWQEVGDFVMLYRYRNEAALHKMSVSDVMGMCHRFPFISFYCFRKGVAAELAYLKKDFQRREKEILERWFQYVMDWEI